MELKARKVALIGGMGFIGHNLALALKSQGVDVAVIDSLQVNNLLMFHSSSTATNNRKLYVRMINQRLDLLREAEVPVFIHDARDYHLISRVLDQINPQVMVHLAAISHAKKSNKNPFSTFDHNLRTLENTLDCARSLKVEQFIFFSSSMVYGNFQSEQVDEKHPLNPIGIYGALKLGGEKLVIAHNQVFDLPYTIIRPSALYGPRCVSRRVIQVFIENALKGQKLRIDGDGSEKLDFTYIDDLVQGICLSMQKPEARNQVFNLTYGSARSIGKMAAVVKQHFPEVEMESVPRDNLMPFRGTLSVDKARSLLGYNPQNPIEVGINKYVDWYKSLAIIGSK